MDKIIRLFRLSCLVLLVLPWLGSCSVTSNLPEGETLYTGVNSIEYLEEGELPHQKKQKKHHRHHKDSTGVITAIADAAQRIDAVLHSVKLPPPPRDTEFSDEEELTKAERDSLRSVRETTRRELEAAKIEVNAVLEAAPNNALFGSAYHRFPIPLGLWAYNRYVNREGKFAGWMYKTFATEPVLVSNVNPPTRVKVATNTLHNFGYFHAKVQSELDPAHNPRKAKVNYYVTPGQVFRLDSIEYRGFPPMPDSLILRPWRTPYLKKGDPFSVLNLTNEQSRLENIYRNAGFYYYKASLATYKADTFAVPYKVQLRLEPKANLPGFFYKRYYMGHTYINVYRHAGDTLSNSMTRRTVTVNYSGRKPPLYPLVFLQNIAHRPRRLYRQRDEERTQEMLAGLGIFNQINVSYARRDTTQTCDTLDLLVSAVLDKRYTLDFEMNVTEKNGDRIGPGLSLSLQKKNAFRGAELLNFKIFGSYEWRTNGETVKRDAFFNSYEVGTQLSIDFPRVVFPGISRHQFRFPTSTKFALTADWLNRSGYFNLFTMGLDATYSWHKTRTSRHEFTPFSLSYDKMINSTHEFDSIMQVNPALYAGMRDRFVPAMQYTYTYTSSRRHRNPLWWQLTVKEAGNVTSGIYALAGKKWGEQNKELFHNPFAQYLKLTTELHNDFKISEKYRLATRLMGGIVWTYGNSRFAPYSDQFYVGGANSIRAFTIRTVGPGRFYTPRSRYSYMDQTGDIKLEANVEFRFPVFGSLGGALFVDAGNVWLMHEDEHRPGGTFKLKHFAKDIALGTGIGLRYDLDFLILRFDLGVALHDPADNGRRGYYNIGKFKDGLTLHFAIGYPF